MTSQLSREREDLETRVYLMCKRRKIEPEMALWDAKVPHRRMLIHCDTDELKQVQAYLRTLPVYCTEKGHEIQVDSIEGEWLAYVPGDVFDEGTAGRGGTRQEAVESLLKEIDEEE